MISIRDRTGPPCEHVTRLLDARAANLNERIGELVALRDEVERLRSRAETLNPAECAAPDVCHVIPMK